MKRRELFIQLNSVPTKEAIVDLLSLDDFTPVYEAADRVRAENVGDTVHLRAIIEFSNICKRRCIYCGLNRDNEELPRFRMSHEEIVETAREAVAAGYRTIVLQSGEDPWFTPERLGAIIEDIKKLGVAVTVSSGEMSEEDYAYLKSKGADRYLLKHETADPELYDRLHPCGTLENRTNCLKTIHKLGYETGSGFMIGLPGQTLETIAEDLLLLREIPCQMAGIGPFISNPKTALAGEKNGDPEMTRRAVAIARLILPEANLPVTTALSLMTEEEKAHSIDQQGEAAAKRSGTDGTAENPFAFGANVVMKKVTPDEYKEAYEIYPADFKPTDIAKDRKELEEIIRSYGREPL
ncbi:MAG: [FeFe] hydrogenase H-cluster radical SAM maturase HydE [Bacillota bacterium]|nr:[FeFe] hydrogenase H-cluster radical SAM maturase HydE [Bacillota bacterium]